MGILEENVFLFRKMVHFFGRTRLKRTNRKKKTETKRRRNTEGVSQKEMKKDCEKGDRMKDEGLGKIIDTVFLKRNCSTRKKGKNK